MAMICSKCGSDLMESTFGDKQHCLACGTTTNSAGKEVGRVAEGIAR